MGLPDVDSIPDTGAVFTIGRSRFADNFASHFFIRQDPVVTIVCGDEHSAVVCQSGRLFVFGSNDWGQLGLGHKNHVSKPSCVKILKPEKVTNVACGRAHTLICTGGEKIFACGSDQEGQLGRGGLAVGDSSSSPILIHDCEPDESRILQVAAGSHHSLALLNDGGVIAWGSNLEGQLGLPGTTGLVNKPTKVPIPEPVKAISAGYYHTAFLTESGLIYVCGESESGKLGIVVNFSTQAAPRQLELPDPAAKIACGGHHSLVLTETGALYCFGSNASGQLGMGANVTEVQTPKLLPRGDMEGEIIAEIAAGESHTAIVTESGKLFMCGDGRHGKLGLEENENNVHEITYAVKYEELVVTDVSCGGCHTMLIGKRREGNNVINDEESGSVNSDVGTSRKSSLPPLKLPAALGRIPGADMLAGDKNIIANAMKSVENSVTDARDSVKEKLTEAGDSVKDKLTEAGDSVKNKLTEAKDKLTEAKEKLSDAKDKLESNVEGVVKNVTETVKEDVETAKKTAEGVFDDVKGAIIGGVKKPEFPTKKLADYIEEGNKTEELLNDLAKETSADIDSKINGARKELTGFNETLMDNIKVHSEDISSHIASPFAGHNEEMDNQIKGIEMDKESEMNILPPPKPPRQKSDVQEGNLLSTSKLLSSAKSSASNGRKKSGESDRAESQNHQIKSQDELSRMTMTHGGEYEQSKNKGTADEDDAKKGEETETAQDDADVVQSPPPKTACGKMSKLFKGKKLQEEQNGINGSGSATKSRVKSRTCALL